MKLGKLAQELGAHLTGPADLEITGVAGTGDAQAGQVTFLGGAHLIRELENTRASAVIVPLDTQSDCKPLLKVKNPRLAFARTIELFYVTAPHVTGINPLSSVAGSAVIGRNVSIHPFAVVEDDVVIGDDVVISPGVYIGRSTVVDAGTIIYANVSINGRVRIGKRVIIHSGAVIGSDGFGFVADGGVHHKIPQVGGVIIEDDVEIGGNCTIDRATLGDTIIKKGTKLDDQVHVAHNVTIGEHCLLAGQAAIAGSSTLGNYVVLGGKAAVSDHITVGDRVMAGGNAAIAKDVPEGQIIAGFNAMPIRDWLKVQAVLPRLPELKKRIADLEKRIKDLEDDKI